MLRVVYTEKLFKDRILANQDTVELTHIGPRMMLCSDEAGMWIAIILNN